MEQELKSRSAAALQNAEEVAQERAESNALRSVVIHKPYMVRSAMRVCLWALPPSVCRILKEQMEQALSDTQHRLSVKTNELHAAHDTINKLEDRLGDLNHLFGLFIASPRCVGTTKQLCFCCVRQGS